MQHLLRQCGTMARTLLRRPTTPTTPIATLSTTPRWFVSHKPRPKENFKPVVNCACARHPMPEEKVVQKKERPKDCDFDFRKLEINPYDDPCDCQDPPPAAGCKDVGRPKEVCCRTTRQYGCFCEEEEESCEEEEEEVEEVTKTCDLDFRKLEVNPYDDPCECHDPPPASSCESLANREDVCCRTQRPFGCDCAAYDQPGLECLKEKGPKQKSAKKECDNKNKWKGKCL